ncbi:MAG: Zn-ribbon domain-containing OB-fold protein [Actinomycetota bacterium]|nr:zinc ribbon domain-containing protein [Actinomycetota bacterium]
MSATKIPAVEGWFTLDDEPRLIGSRCATCGTYFFPKELSFCRNPSCDGTELTETPLSRTGKVWSYTVNHYAPPPPYVAADPFVPFGVAAVELSEERMMILGQTTGHVAVGDDVELIVDTLYTDDKGEHVVWKWARA